MNSDTIDNLDDNSVARSVRAAEQYHRSRQVPDPLDRKDCLKRPDLVATAVRQRILRGEEWGTPSAIRSPKLAGGDRILVVLDPLAEVYFREKGDHLFAIDHELSNSVFHARTVCLPSSGWQIRSWQERHPEWERIKAESQQPTIGSGMLDVRDHYPTISNENLADLLQSHGIPQAKIRDLIQSLGNLHELPGIPSGLPVDMELSALLGTAILLPIDCLLSDRQIEFYRWVDDIILLGVSEQHFLDLVGSIAQMLQSRGQCLNEEKSRWLDRPEEMLLYMTEPPGNMSLDQAVDVLRRAATSGDFEGVTKAFGALRQFSASIGLELITEHPILLYRAPSAAGRYLRKMSSAAIADKWEPLLDLLPDTNVGPDRELAMVHLTRCFPHDLLSEQFRREAWDRCVGQDVETAPTVVNFIANLTFRGLSGRQIKRFRREALELIDAVVDFGLRRVLIAGFRYGGTPARKDANRLREIGKNDPDLACTVEWVLAA